MRSAVAILCLLGTTICVGQAIRLPQILPVDVAKSDAALQQVRDAALAAVRAKDLDGLMAVVSRDVLLGEGADGPRDAPRALRAALSSPAHEWWHALEDALSLGGGFTTTRGALEARREFCAPYYYATFPAEVPEPVRGETSPWAIIDKNVAVHAAPDAKSRVLAHVSYALIRGDGAAQRDVADPQVLWQSVGFPPGSPDAEAFVLASKIRNPEGFHVCFAKEPVGWRISLISDRRAL